MDDVQLDVKLTRGAPRPRYARPGDAGMDLTARESCTIAPGGRRLMPTGVSVSIPEGHAGLVLPRSGLAAKFGLTITNAPGLIDSGYRGEIGAILQNTDLGAELEVEAGERICQLVIVPVAHASCNVVDELDATARGEDGFGSTGVE